MTLSYSTMVRALSVDKIDDPHIPVVGMTYMVKVEGRPDYVTPSLIEAVWLFLSSSNSTLMIREATLRVADDDGKLSERFSGVILRRSAAMISVEQVFADLLQVNAGGKIVSGDRAESEAPPVRTETATLPLQEGRSVELLRVTVED